VKKEEVAEEKKSQLNWQKTIVICLFMLLFIPCTTAVILVLGHPEKSAAWMFAKVEWELYRSKLCRSEVKHEMNKILFDLNSYQNIKKYNRQWLDKWDKAVGGR